MSCEASAWLRAFSGSNRIVLGSGSRTRKRVLDEAGVRVSQVVSPDIDEKAIRAPTPEEMTGLIATAKARAVIERLSPEPAFVICSDMVAVFKGVVREKPSSPAEAREFLMSYSKGEPVGLVGTVVVVDTASGKRASRVHECLLMYRPFEETVLEEILKGTAVYSGCGGVSIDGEILGDHVDWYKGGWDGVMGLPIRVVEELIREVLA